MIFGEEIHIKTKGKAKGEVILKGFFLYLFIGFMMKS